MGVRQSVHRRHASQPAPAMTTTIKIKLIIGLPSISRMGRFGLHHPRPAPCALGVVRWPIHPASFCCNRASSSAVKSHPSHPPAAHDRVQMRSCGGCVELVAHGQGHRSISSKEASVSGGASIVPSGPQVSGGRCGLVVSLGRGLSSSSSRFSSYGQPQAWTGFADRPHTWIGVTAGRLWAR